MQIIRRLVAAMVTVLLLSATLPARAQEQTPGSGLSISPTSTQLTIKPGQSDPVNITLKNITTDDINAVASVVDFKSDNNSGNPQLITNTTQRTPNSIYDFVFGLGNIPLAKGEQKTVTLAMQVPAKTPPGAYYGVIRYKAVPTGKNAPGPGQVALSASVATIVLITVPGNIRSQVQLTGLHVYSGKHEGTFFFHKPDKTGVEVRNLGNGFEQPFGTVEIQDIFGKSAYNYQLNKITPPSNVLPNSSRIFVDKVKNINKIGRYTLTANVSYGSGSQVLVLKKTFWYIPVWFLVIVLVLILALALGVLLAYRKYRRVVKRSYRRRS